MDQFRRSGRRKSHLDLAMPTLKEWAFYSAWIAFCILLVVLAKKFEPVRDALMQHIQTLASVALQALMRVSSGQEPRVAHLATEITFRGHSTAERN